MNQKGYWNIDKDPDMGLNNTICKSKDYFCSYKRVYLTEQEAQKCLNKQTYDMMSVFRCPHLKEVKENK